MSALLVSLICISACSSGGSGEDSKPRDSSNRLKEITINGLDYGLSKEFYEGETVTVSLNAQGDGASSLSYDWTVEDGIDFRGQNTDTITFIAPQVTGYDSISVSVELSLDGGTLCIK